MSKTKEIVIVSGKGGTGKTSVAAGLADLSTNAVFCDCDVDAANLALALGAKERNNHKFVASKRAFVEEERCAGCDVCGSTCRFAAISKGDVDALACEGCGLCARVCPSHAIEMRPVLSGHWFVSDTLKGPMVHARLGPGEENSGKLVALVRQEARRIAQAEGRDVLISDGPPGIGCPVIASLSGADAALVVTEPTLSGIHDLSRILKVCRRFGVPPLIVINKFDIHAGNTGKIERFAWQEGLKVAGRIPYDPDVPRAMAVGIPITRYDTSAARCVRELWGTCQLEEIVT